MSTGKSAIPDVQAAAMALLATDSTFMGLVPGGVWDYVPENPSWPYVCLEAAREQPDDTYGAVGSQGREVELVFSIFSQYQGRNEQSAILNRLIALLRYTPLTITNWTHRMTTYDGATQYSILEIGNTRAGSTQATFTVRARES